MKKYKDTLVAKLRKARRLSKKVGNRDLAKLRRTLSPDEYAHRRSVNNRLYERVRNRKLPRPSIFKCAACNNQAKVYHHTHYDCEWKLVALCDECHRKVHSESYHKTDVYPPIPKGVGDARAGIPAGLRKQNY